MDKKDSVIEIARERYQEAEQFWSETREEMLDDLKFSNPADPQQWDERIKRQRENAGTGARPCLVFDQTNQYLAQVVNDARENKPSVKVRPEDGQADVKVASSLQGVVKHIEDVSRAGIAYDTAIEYAARCGLGWFRLSVKTIDGKMNMQELSIDRIHDPMQVLSDPYWCEPDGSDMTYLFLKSSMSKTAFERKYPGKSTASWYNGDAWCTKDEVKICEYFEIVESETNMIVVQDEATGDMMEYSEDDYWKICSNIGESLPQVGTFKANKRKCVHRKITGNDVLEETEFPASFIPFFPTIGNETWIDGKRHLSGMVRRMKDAQRAYNYERSAYIEMVSLQPKAPYLAAYEAIEGHEEAWKVANTSNQSVLVYNHLDSEGNPLPSPSRQAPISASNAFVQGAQLALADIQSSIGMYSANLGKPSNETSGRAITARQREGDTANFHYIDNLARSITHMGKVILEAIPVIYDTKREARILGEDGKESHITVDPNAPEAAAKYSGKLIINPNIGKYDVSVSVGPAYATRRQESVDMIGQLTQGNPQLAAALTPMMVKLADLPEAEKAAKIAIALLPPPVQQAYHDDDSDIAPEIKAKMDAQAKQIKDAESTMQELKAALDSAHAQLDSKQAETELKQQELMLKVASHRHEAAKAVATLKIAEYNAETARLKVEAPYAQPTSMQGLTEANISDMIQMPEDLSTINADTTTTIMQPQQE